MNYQAPYAPGPPVMHDPYAVMAPPAADYGYLGPPQYPPNAAPYDLAPAPVPKPVPLIQASAHLPPTNPAGGGGGGFHAHHHQHSAAGGRSMINVNTNSKDPSSMKSRVFVGNLNTNLVPREEIQRVFAPFGEILAISMHKGYAFVQYGYESEARNAVSFTDGTMMAGKRIDVTVASEPKTAGDSSSGINKRSANVTIPLGGTPEAKRQKITLPAIRTNTVTKRMGSSNIGGSGANKAALNIVNKAKATPTRVQAVPDGGVKPETLEKGDDIIICGICRHLFRTVDSFTSHKKADKCYAPPAVAANIVKNETDNAVTQTSTESATVINTNGADAEEVESKPKFVGKAEGEPDSLQCFICHDPFDRSWNLLVHINQKHNMKVYELSEENDKSITVSGAATPTKK